MGLWKSKRNKTKSGFAMDEEKKKVIDTDGGLK
jgi:hypothetical protein